MMSMWPCIGVFLCLPALLDSRKVLIIAGNFSFNGALANLAEYDYTTGTWLQNFEPGLYLYGASNGVILDIVTNSTGTKHDKAYLVGAFDSDAQTSQVAYCSVGEWSGDGFAKVGEGLCPRGVDSSSTTSIRSVVLGTSGHVIVGGNFHARVWNGMTKSFVDAYDLAIYDTPNGWLPLVGGGQLKCLSEATCVAGVYSLAWDDKSEILYIGGIFDSLNGAPLSTSICQWSVSGGIQPFAGGGMTNKPNNSVYTQVTSLAFEKYSESLFVAGSYYYAGDLPCQNIAVWNRSSGLWKCLYQASASFSVITAMHLDVASMSLFVAGWASAASTWRGYTWGCPYAAAVTNVKSLLFPDRAHTYASTQGGNSFPFLRQGRKLMYQSASYDHSSPFTWEWLRGFPGGNGPIFSILPIPGTDWVVIGGAFNNYHAVVIWFSGNYSTRPLNNATVLSGDVATLALMDISAKTKTHNKKEEIDPSFYMKHRIYFALSAAVFLFVVVGIAFLVGFKTKIEYESIMSEAEANADENFAVDIDITTISLNALTGGMKSRIDIDTCFENAMRSRHVRFRESLMSIKSDEINLTRIIGEGSYGRVWAGRWRHEPVAVKEFVFAQTALMGGSIQTAELIEEIIGEAGIMSLLKHPKILQLYGVSLTSQTIWIVSELCTRGSLRMLLNTNTDLPFLSCVSISLDIAEGLNYLHTRRPPIIHRDLKSHNIFMNESSPGLFTAKIGDWGSARAIAVSGGIRSMTQGVGTTCWLAPEVIEHAHSSMASDIYAFGIILWEIFTRKEVFVGLTSNQIIARVVKSGLRPVVPNDCPINELMQSCWAQNPADRPSFKSIIQTLSEFYNVEVDRLNYDSSSDDDDSI